MITAEIAGYTFNADNYCPECIREWVLFKLGTEGYQSPVDISTWTTEGLLNALAALWDVDRDYADSNDYPVPFSGQTAITDKQLAVCDGDPTPRCAGNGCHNDFTGEF